MLGQGRMPFERAVRHATCTRCSVRQRASACVSVRQRACGVRAECVRSACGVRQSASECVRDSECDTVCQSASECGTVRQSASECVRVRYRASECGTVRYRAVQCNILILSFNWLVEGSKVPLPPFPEVCLRLLPVVRLLVGARCGWLASDLASRTSYNLTTGTVAWHVSRWR